MYFFYFPNWYGVASLPTLGPDVQAAEVVKCGETEVHSLFSAVWLNVCLKTVICNNSVCLVIFFYSRWLLQCFERTG